jgi:hypothetical protein
VYKLELECPERPQHASNSQVVKQVMAESTANNVSVSSPEKKADESNNHARENFQTREVRTDSVVKFRARPSMMSSEHPENNYRGFVNVLIILLVRC